jgi:hypothetical protein|tara:strand:+ start:74 stop:274 length:201 start_codon:yes stop_codon:yes gene_type:complete
MFINEMYLWLLGTAAIFTVFGYLIDKDKITKDIIGSVVDDLIEQGFLKTEQNDVDDEVILVKWPDD